MWSNFLEGTLVLKGARNLSKAWDPNEHPRHPAGTPQSKGGEFARRDYRAEIQGYLKEGWSDAEILARVGKDFQMSPQAARLIVNVERAKFTGNVDVPTVTPVVKKPSVEVNAPQTGLDKIEIGEADSKDGDAPAPLRAPETFEELVGELKRIGIEVGELKPAPIELSASRADDFKKYGDADHRAAWDVSEGDYIAKQFEKDKAGYARQVEYAKAELEKLGPRATSSRVKAEAAVAFWERQVSRMDVGGMTPELTQKYREQYIELVKRAISKGEPVPLAVINQRPEFRVAKTARERYEKGRHTSFANRSAAVNDTMKAARGFKVKRQDGTAIPDAQIDEITRGVDEIESLFGSMKPYFEQTDLTIAHTNGKHPFLKDSGGLYSIQERVITTGVANKITGKPIPSLAHEWAHWLDYEAGAATGMKVRQVKNWRAYDDTSVAEVEARDWTKDTLIREATRKINKVREIKPLLNTAMAKLPEEKQAEAEQVRVVLGDYWHEPREVWARLVEQYAATRLPKTAISVGHNYGTRIGYWTDEDFAKFAPRVESEVWRRLDLLRGVAVTKSARRVEQRIWRGQMFGTMPYPTWSVG